MILIQQRVPTATVRSIRPFILKRRSKLKKLLAYKGTKLFIGDPSLEPIRIHNNANNAGNASDADIVAAIIIKFINAFKGTTLMLGDILDVFIEDKIVSFIKAFKGTTLDLSENDLFRLGSSRLVKYIEAFKGATINLSDTGITRVGAAGFVDVIKAFRGTTLNLSENELHMTGSDSLVNAMKVFKGTTLNLSYNRLSVLGAINLIRIVTEFKGSILDLSQNHLNFLEDYNFIQMVSAFKGNTLNLSSNDLYEFNAESLVNLVGAFNGTTLNLSANRLDKCSANKIARIINAFKGTTLNLTHNDFSLHNDAYLKKAFEAIINDQTKAKHIILEGNTRRRLLKIFAHDKIPDNLFIFIPRKESVIKPKTRLKTILHSFVPVSHVQTTKAETLDLITQSDLVAADVAKSLLDEISAWESDTDFKRRPFYEMASENSAIKYFLEFLIKRIDAKDGMQALCAALVPYAATSSLNFVLEMILKPKTQITELGVARLNTLIAYLLPYINQFPDVKDLCYLALSGMGHFTDNEIIENTNCSETIINNIEALCPEYLETTNTYEADTLFRTYIALKNRAAIKYSPQ